MKLAQKILAPALNAFGVSFHPEDFEVNNGLSAGHAASLINQMAHT